ncbi:glycoside hydrolase family 15 protein [Actinomadura sp. LOL_016]|uniref:glycoside hydrolase family 15 protein n=1 Tax=unclassified Actinomadura TaxID=2626254 RepID=UPI003A7F88E8
MAGTPLEDYGLLSDRHSAALVSRAGTVDWLCFPRFDSPSVFGALLDERAGSWSVRPAADATGSRRYLDGTLVSATEFTTPSGTVELVDAMATGDTGDPHRLGAAAPHLLIRRLACATGAVEVTVEFRPRPEYGLVVPVLTECEGGVHARGGPAALTLTSPVQPTVDGGAAAATVLLRAGQVLHLALHWAPLEGPPPRLWSQEELAAQLDLTIAAWRGWSRMHQNYEGPWQELVWHSGRVLQGLSYQPTGAIVAAATTSLPEETGGERNWDYRYAWVRDAAFTMDALWVAACPDEAEDFFAFMTSAATTSWTHPHLQIVYGVGGEHDLSERRLAHLSGWRGSRPVRIGNGAWSQPQLDVYGELMDTAVRFQDQLNTADEAKGTDTADTTLGTFLISLADTAAHAWRSPDHGIWEIRGAPQHFLYSKLMCWVALDRALSLAGRLGATDRADRWRSTREEIRSDILTHGWNRDAGAFTQSYGNTTLDASALMLPVTGFLPADDPRVLATIDAVTTHLADGNGLIRRYRTESGVDGMAGGEGSFLLCTFWLAQAQAMAGRLTEARATFERAAAHVGDLGLLAEQADSATGRLLGNFPQALSHIGLVNAAWAIATAEGGHHGPSPSLRGRLGVR